MLSTFLAAVTAGAQASIWPYHGSAAGSPAATGAIIVEDGGGDDYYDYGQRLTLAHQYQQQHQLVNGAVIGSLAANPIVVKGPVTSSKGSIAPRVQCMNYTRSRVHPRIGSMMRERVL